MIKLEFPNTMEIPSGYFLEGYQTYYGAVVNNPLFREWMKVGEERGFDIPESVECGIMSDEHFQAFLDWVKDERPL